MSKRADMKKRLSVYLDPELMRLLADFADRREQSRSIMAEAAIASFLSPDADERQEAAPPNALTESTAPSNGWSATSASPKRPSLSSSDLG